MTSDLSWLIGCSGFSYKEWKNSFYPEKLSQKEWFEFYASHFNSLELNVTFYRFPQLSILKNWYKRSPDGFVFSVKAPRVITHYKKFSGTEELMTDFYKTVQKGLKNKIGCILFQLPATISYSPEHLDRIINSVSHSFNNVIEFRHQSWWNEEVRKALTANKIIFCSVSISGLSNEVMADSDIVYYRFHGVPLLYRSAYSNRELKKISDIIFSNKNVGQAYIYFNNTANSSAIRNAQWMESYCEKHSLLR